jgi:hypothetical protein
MPRNILLAAGTLSLCSHLSVATLLQAAESTAGLSPIALVQQALATELDGPSDARQELLTQALALDADFGPARWHSGFVRFEGQWLSPAEVAQRSAGDKRLADYRKRRDAMVDTAEQHRELARWCRKNARTR